MRYLILDKRQRIAITGDLPKRVTRLLEELDKQRIDATFAYYDSIDVIFENGSLIIQVDGEDITKFTYILFGGHQVNSTDYELKQLIVSAIDKWNNDKASDRVLIQNASAMRLMPIYTKMWMAKMCADNGIPHLRTIFSAGREYHRNIEPLQYPIILKINSGENAIKLIDGQEKVKKNVFLVEGPDSWNPELLEAIKDSDYLAQEFTPVGEDYRIFVANGKVIGGWRRVSPPDSFMTVTKGSSYFYHNDPTVAERELAERVAKAFGADFIAVDLIYKGNSPYVLEFSLHPGFNAYETKCQDGEPVNIAEAIVNAFPKS